MNVKGLKQYRSDELHTADPRKIVLLLYEGAINFLKAAKECATLKDVSGRAYNINRATAIVLELLNALDFERGGEVARHLRDLYVFLLRRLIEANKGNQPAIIAECIPVLETLHDGWNEAMFRPKNRASAEQLSSMSYSFQI
jgi:flagellar protein FliS